MVGYLSQILPVVSWQCPGLIFFCLACSGTLPNGLDAHSLRALRAWQLSGNALSGTLPDSWGRGEGLRSLLLFDASGNNLTGQLPPSWFQGNAFPALKYGCPLSQYLQTEHPLQKQVNVCGVSAVMFANV